MDFFISYSCLIFFLDVFVKHVGPITKDYGKHGMREIGTAKKHDAFGEFPANFVPSGAF